MFGYIDMVLDSAATLLKLLTQEKKTTSTYRVNLKERLPKNSGSLYCLQTNNMLTSCYRIDLIIRNIISQSKKDSIL